MKNHVNILLIFFIVLFSTIKTVAYNYTDTTYIITKPITNSIDFNKFVTVYKSEIDNNLDSLLYKIQTGEITKTNNSSARGFSEDYFWIFFKLKNEAENDIDFILKNATPNLDSVYLFSLNSDNEIDTLFKTGKKLEFKERTIQSSQIYFPLILEKNSKSRLYILKVSRIKNTVVFPLSLENTKDFYSSLNTKRIIHFVYFSLLFVIIFISIIMGVLIKQKVLVYYGFYILTLGLFFLTYKAYATEFIYPSYPILEEYTSILKLFILIGIILFFSSFLNLHKHNKALKRFYDILIILDLLILVMFIIDYSDTKLIGYKIFYYLSIFTLISFPYTLYKIYKKDKASVIIFTAALFFVVLGTLTAMLVGLGVLPGWILNYDTMLIGSFFEVVIFTVSIIYKIYTHETDRRILLLKDIAIQKEMLEAYQTGSKKKNSKITNELDTKVTEKLDNIKALIKNETDKKIITKQISEVYEDVRIISHKLSHQTLKIVGLESSLKSLVNDISKNANTKISINFIDFIDLFDKKGLYIYNVIQEAIENAITHSKCSEIVIEVIGHDDETNFTIDDDGIGFEINKLESKTNILNMQTRIELIGGTFEISSFPDKGTNIFFSISKTN